MKAFIMDGSSKIPTAAQYCFTPRNCLVEDEKVLHNIPYLGEHQASNSDQGVLGELLESYNNKVHELDEKMVSQTLTNLVEELLDQEGPLSKLFPSVAGYKVAHHSQSSTESQPRLRY